MENSEEKELGVQQENFEETIEEVQEFKANYPPLITRLKCTLTDTMVVIVLMIISTQVLESFNNPPVWARIIALGLVVLYEPLCIAFGRTFGQLMMGLKVVRFDDFRAEGKQHNIGLVLSIVRYIVKILLGSISLLTVTNNKHKKAIHDSISGSLMIFAKS